MIQNRDKEREYLKKKADKEEDKIIEVLKEKVENATQEELQKANLILKSFEKIREQEKERIEKLIDWLEKNPCKFCGNVKYCVDGETKCERWFEFKQKLKQKEE